MKIIEVPATIKAKPFGTQALVNRDVEVPEMTFKDFLIIHLDSYSSVKSTKMVRQVNKIADAIEKSNGTISLEDADFDVLKAAVEEVKVVPGMARQLLSYYDAIEKAQDVKK